MTNNTSFAAVILAAGRGTRMKSDLPKVMHKVAGRSMVAHVAAAAKALNPDHVAVVTAETMPEVLEAAQVTAPDAVRVIQHQQLGTGDAVKAAKDVLEDYTGTTLVLYGDTPLLRPETLQRMLEAAEKHSVVVLGMRPADAGAYGRLVTSADGSLERIVEFKDANEAERAINLCNSGVMAVGGGKMMELLADVTDDNAQGEYYLTDVVGIANGKGLSCGVVEAEEWELQGVNSRVELSKAEAVFQAKQREAAMVAGVTLIDPETVYFAADTELGRDVIIHPHVMFGAGVRVADGATIHGFSHIEGATIGEGASVGPFARLRPGAVLDEGVKVGNFVEVKNTHMKSGAKASHLSYLGDAVIGEGSNIGAGTITCNYDGYDKYKTVIGSGVFIGSDSTLVAPVTVDDGAFVAAGSCITDDVEGDALAIARERQQQKAGWAAEFKRLKKKS